MGGAGGWNSVKCCGNSWYGWGGRLAGSRSSRRVASVLGASGPAPGGRRRARLDALVAVLCVCAAHCLVSLARFGAGRLRCWLSGGWRLRPGGGGRSIPLPGTGLCGGANLVWKSFGFRAVGGAACGAVVARVSTIAGFDQRWWPGGSLPKRTA